MYSNFAFANTYRQIFYFGFVRMSQILVLLCQKVRKSYRSLGKQYLSARC